MAPNIQLCGRHRVPSTIRTQFLPPKLPISNTTPLIIGRVDVLVILAIRRTERRSLWHTDNIGTAARHFLKPQRFVDSIYSKPLNSQLWTITNYLCNMKRRNPKHHISYVCQTTILSPGSVSTAHNFKSSRSHPSPIQSSFLRLCLCNSSGVKGFLSRDSKLASV